MAMGSSRRIMKLLVLLQLLMWESNSEQVFKQVIGEGLTYQA